MSIPIIKLLCDGELEEVNINCKKKENYNLNNFLKKINLDEEVYYSELHSWDLDQKKKHLLLNILFMEEQDQLDLQMKFSKMELKLLLLEELELLASFLE